MSVSFVAFVYSGALEVLFLFVAFKGVTFMDVMKAIYDFVNLNIVDLVFCKETYSIIYRQVCACL